MFSAVMDPTLEARLVEAVPDPAQFGRVRALLEASLRALHDFNQMDESLFERLEHGEGRVMDDEHPATVLMNLEAATLQGLRSLLAFLDAQGFFAPADEAGPVDDDMDFDLGEGPSKTDELGLDEFDIDGVLSSLAPQPAQPAVNGDAEFRKVAGAIGYGLKSQLLAFQERFDLAVQGGHYRQAMEDLDDTRNATGEGIFALVSAVCETYAPGVRPDGVVPGYKSTLQKALLVRRGLSDLTRIVDRENWFLQDKTISVPEQAGALARLRQVLGSFLASEVCKAMRPADRWELVKVHRAIDGKPLGAATRQACEGLAKYLESLSSINQREALRRHDAEVLHELRQNLEAAQPLLTISAATALGLVKESLKLAMRLYGRGRELDALLVRWRLTPPDLGHASDVEDVITQLSRVLNQAGA